jgi:hypothetical protein
LSAVLAPIYFDGYNHLLPSTNTGLMRILA